MNLGTTPATRPNEFLGDRDDPLMVNQKKGKAAKSTEPRSAKAPKTSEPGLDPEVEAFAKRFAD